MFSFLKSPFPSTYGQKSNVLVALFSGLFVAFFLVIFQPFGISEHQQADNTLITMGYGVVTFLVLLFIYFIIPKLFPGFFVEKKYTVGKDLLLNAFLILLVGIANSIYSQICNSDVTSHSLLGMIWKTFLVGIFPITVLSLVQYNRLLKANIKASKDIQIAEVPDTVNSIKLNEPRYYKVVTDQETIEIDLNDLLFWESDGNYAHLHQYKDENYSKTLHRTTMKALEHDNAHLNIVRCHRSYIVNLDKVSEVTGNAQGLKLTLQNCEEPIPVSRKYISEIKDYFNRRN